MARPVSRPSNPLPPRMQLLLREARALLVGFAALLLAAILLTYDPVDPSFSTTGDGGALHNLGGSLGAKVSDALLLVFGLSAWWWVLLALAYVVHTFRHLDETPLAGGRQRWLKLGGFGLLLLASSGLEWLRTWHWAAALPGGIHGGVLGKQVGDMTGTLLGFTGGSLILLVLTAVGFSLFTGVSWLDIAERTGEWIERGYWKAKDSWKARRDRKLGEVAQQKREAKVSVEKKKRVEAPPIRIEPVVKEIPQSERAVTEKQAPLFSDLPDSPLPPLHLLDPAVEAASPEALEFTSLMIERKLAEFGVEVKVVSASPGPVITRYEIEPATGVKGSQIVNLAKDLARTLSVISIRVVEAIPGKHTMGLEIPNAKRQMVRLSEILGSRAYHDSASPLTVTLGKDIAGNPVVADLGKMPHLLVAGTTGSGKSVGVNAMILSLVYKSDPSAVRMIMVDPKMLELSIYEGIPHLLAPVVTDMKQAASALNWCVAEMERRYKLMSAVGVRNLAGYNQKVRDAKKAGTPLTHPFSLTPDNPEPLETMPMIVVMIDELADLMMVVGKKVEELIARLAQKARAAGIHLILATQRPRHHRPHQGQHPDPHRLPGFEQDRLAHDSGSNGCRGAAGAGRHALPAARHRPAAAGARRLRVGQRGAPRGRLPEVAGGARIHRGRPLVGRGRRRGRRRVRRGGCGSRPAVRPGRRLRAEVAPRIDLVGAAPVAHRLQPGRAHDRGHGARRTGVGDAIERQPRCA